VRVDLSDVLKVAGFGSICAAGFVLGVVPGLLVLGVVLLVAGWLVER
jgi:hypothetical protein